MFQTESMRVFRLFYLLLVICLCCNCANAFLNSSELLHPSFGEPETNRGVLDEYKTICYNAGCVCEGSAIRCSGVDPHAVESGVFGLLPDARLVSFTDCSEEIVDFNLFANLSELTNLSIRGCGVEKFLHPDKNITKLRYLDLQSNYITSWDAVVSLLRWLPNLVSVNLANNLLQKISDDDVFLYGLHQLNLSHNQISNVGSVPFVEDLDLSGNRLGNISALWPNKLVKLNLSANSALSLLNNLSLPNLEYLNLHGTSISSLPVRKSASLRFLVASCTLLESLDFDELGAPLLEEVDLSNSKFLCSVFGELPRRMVVFRLSGSLISSFPPAFFSRARNLAHLQLDSNRLSRNKCLMKWCDYLPLKVQKRLNCSESETSDRNCSLGIDGEHADHKIILRAPLDKRGILPCDAFGQPAPTFEWWLVRPETQIGVYDMETRQTNVSWSRNGIYRILPGGYLSISRARKDVVERYRCVATNRHGNTSLVIHFRLDYSIWFGLAYPTAVFWGSVLSSLVFCAISFLFNVSWIVCRKAALWWIKRTERLSRVRKMVEACEKYRQRQMENLHEAYHRRIEQIRDNYHQQVEQLRSSYASQAERFRGYRAAQKTYVNQHLDSIRENYNQQMCRLREYGSRRAEQLWESYERQMNRIRTFSLQQRLRLIRQYKVKQQYVNTLLEKFGDNSPATSLIAPQAEEAVLDPLQELDAASPLSRSESYYSLPEYVLDEEGELHCPPRSDIPNHMLNRHQHNLLFEQRSEEDMPSTSKAVHFRKTDVEAVAASHDAPTHPRRCYSLVDASSSDTGTNTFPVTKLDNV